MKKIEWIKVLIPAGTRSWLRQRGITQKGLLLLDRVTDWSVLRRLSPYRPEFGSGRGRCIDRFYIEKFLATHQDSIRGRVAEFGDDRYTQLFGVGKVTQAEVLDLDKNNGRRTLTLDLADTQAAPEDAFDCILCTNVLLLIFDYESAIRTLFKMLRPGGTLLATLPGISQRVRGKMVGGAGSDWWRFTGDSAERIFATAFGDTNVVVQTYGNVLSAVALLHGLVCEELEHHELDSHDPDYEVIIGIKATKLGSLWT